MAHEPDREFTTTLARGIDILACFRADRPVLANKDFAAQTGLSRSAVARLTAGAAPCGARAFSRETRWTRSSRHADP